MPPFTQPALLLRAESAALLVLAVALYAWEGGSWWLFALLLLAPDLAFLGSLAGPAAGVAAYNMAHAGVGPAVLALVGLLGDWDLGISLALIWFAHLALDRLVGYGLKYTLAKQDTHLDRV